LIIYFLIKLHLPDYKGPIPVVARSKTLSCGSSLAEIAWVNPTGT